MSLVPVRTEPGPVPGPAPKRPRVSRASIGYAALVVVALGIGVVISQGLARLAGDWVRRGALLSVETSPAGSVPEYSDATAGAAAFFAARDTVQLRVPYDMRVSEFLSLYHQVNNPGARAALRDQLGVSRGDDLLHEGERVRIPLTVSGAPR